MLSSASGFERRALNKVTFGARDLDVAYVKQIGWGAYVEEQLHPPPGDEELLAGHIASCSMRIAYAVQLPAGASPGWPAVDQRRGLNYLATPLSAIWEMVSKTEISIAPNERTRIQQELNAVTWIRNTHARYQLREFMADFWNNHFNVGRQEDIYASAALAAYDSEVIRPRVFGNFRDLLEAVATSASMLRYLNNAASGATAPTENYVRELMELHTLGGDAYLGVSASSPATVPSAGFTVAEGFTDADVVQAARAFSGWTLENGQQGPNGALPFTGHFAYNPVQHNTQAGGFMGVDLAGLTADMAQGRRILDILAAHPVTAAHLALKICRRIFGDNPPQAVVTHARDTWLANRDQPDQIGRVLREIMLSPEMGDAPAKVRRPYEKLIALFRTTGIIVTAYDGAFNSFSPIGDGIFAWPTPDGRPDTNAQWLSTAANRDFWNLMFELLDHPAFNTTFAMQTPEGIGESAIQVVEYWVGRMIGHELRPEGMDALIADVLGPIGVVAAYRSRGIRHIENALRRLAVLIATSPEFAVR